MSVYLGADLHLGHNNIAKYRTQFTSMREHDEAVLEMLHETITKRGTYYLLGDVCFTSEALGALSKLNRWSNIRIVLGNHDTDREIGITDWVNSGFTKIYSLLKYKEFWLSHAPIHPDELRGSINIHGHCHEKVIDDGRYFGVSLEQIEYKLISVSDIRKNILGKRVE